MDDGNSHLLYTLAWQDSENIRQWTPYRLFRQAQRGLVSSSGHHISPMVLGKFGPSKV